MTGTAEKGHASGRSARRRCPGGHRAGRVRYAAAAAAAVAASVVLAACGGTSSNGGTSAGGAAAGGAQSSAPLTIAWNSDPDASYLPLLMAVKTLQGQGYSVRTETLSGAAAVAEALATNRAQLSEDNVTGLAAAASKGAPLRIIQSLASNDVVWIVKSADQQCAKLDGQPVGIFGPASSSAYTSEMEYYFSQNCPSAHPTLVTIPDSTLRAQALLNGQIDGTVLDVNDASVVAGSAKGSQFTEVPMSKLLPGVADNYVLANQDVITSNSGAVQAFEADVLKAIRELYSNSSSANLALARQYLTKGTYTSAGLLTLIKDRIWYPSGSVNAAGLTKTLQLFKLPGSAQALTSTALLTKAAAQVGS